MDRIAVLASGGLDSSILMADKARSAEIHPLYVQWGLPWEVTERESLQAFLSAIKSPNTSSPTVISVPIKAVYGDHWSLRSDRVPSADDPDSAVFLPGRNILLIGLAAVWCSTHDVSKIAIGSLAGNPFPDATPKFFSDFASALSSGMNHPIEVKAAFRDLRKWELIKLFSHLPLGSTLTCM